VRVVSRERHGADEFVRRHIPKYPQLTLQAVDTVTEALDGADIVCAVSTSRTPIISRAVVRPGVHINGVGSHGPDVREVDGATMRDARVLVDSKISAMRECGDCILAIDEGMFDEAHVADELGAALAGVVEARRSDSEITVYQSCGLAVQDVAVGHLAVAAAAELGIGALFEMA
jgi:ornithine cyclodeaminase/alanine dehydrogenase-like protein (mu-crystallin family)